MNEYALVQAIWAIHQKGQNTPLPSACIHEVILCLSRLMASVPRIQLQEIILEMIKHGQRANERLGNPIEEESEPVPLGMNVEEEQLLQIRLARTCTAGGTSS